MDNQHIIDYLNFARNRLFMMLESRQIPVTAYDICDKKLCRWLGIEENLQMSINTNRHIGEI